MMTTTPELNPLAVRRPFVGHNGGPPLDDEPANDNTANDNVASAQPPHIAAFQTIDDLFEEAKNFADGEPISSEAMHDAMTNLREQLHEAGKVAEALRVAEKKPLDDKIAEIQGRYNKYVQPKKGKVDMGKAAIDALTTPWRASVLAAKQAEAVRIAQQAREAEEAARLAMQSSAGDLTARVEAEQYVDNAKAWGNAARQANKAATTGTGLRTSWVGTVTDWVLAMDWSYSSDEQRFRDLVEQMVGEAVRAGVRTIPGVVIEERRVAA